MERRGGKKTPSGEHPHGAEGETNMKRAVCMGCLLLCLLGLPAGAFGALQVELTAEENAVRYAFSVPEARFVLLTYTAPCEMGEMTLYSEDGVFSGTVSLPLSGCGGKATLTVQSLKRREMGRASVTLPQAEGYVPPAGKGTGKAKGLTLTETAEGIHYAFDGSGADYLTLTWQNKQESGKMPVYPDADGHFEGDISLRLTYARVLTHVRVTTAGGSVLAEETARKGYRAPEAPEARTGRLSGVTVCVDPGHQENGRMVSEPLGPGLQGKTSGTAGMAQGVVTRRKEAILCLEIGMALRDELIRQGATVVMTREDQTTFHTNMERCAIAEEGGADFMLRLHCDTRENGNTRGMSVYAPLRSSYAAAVADKETYRAMAQTLLDDLKRAVGYETVDRTGRVTLSDQFVGNNWAKMPCFLIEMGYLSNVQDDLLLSAPEYQQMLAAGMAQGVYDMAVSRGLIKGE